MNILELIQRYGFEVYELTERHYGNSLRYGPLKQLNVWDRFVSDASEFEALGYGVICRQSKDS